MLATKPSLVNTGLYPLPQAARLLGVSGSTLRRWLDPVEGLVARSLEPSTGALTFMELMELQFVKLFRDEGVSLQTIRKAATAASKKFQTDYPFAVKRFETDGKAIFATLQKTEREELIIEELAQGQVAFEQVVRPFFRKLDYRNHSEEALRYWPLEKSGRVVLDPTLRFGDPLDYETGVPTRTLFDAYQTEGEAHLVAEWFEVPLEAVQSAIRFEESLRP